MSWPHLSRRPASLRLAVMGPILIVLALQVAACSSSAGTTVGGAGAAPTPTAPHPTATAGSTTATATPASSSVPVQVFFSRHPETDSNANAVFPVARVSPDLGVIKYSIQQLIAGPTATEQAAGYFTPLTSVLSGASSCSGADFKVTRDVRGTTLEIGTVTLQFCRSTSLPGDLTGGIITAEVTKTILQFPNNQKVVILTQDGHCFDDLSGRDACLG